MLRPIAATLMLGLLAAGAGAQQVWVVDDTAGAGVDFTEPQAAINAAADGDTILLRAGSYASALIIDAKSLTVVADAGATVSVQGLRVRHLASHQSVAVIGLSNVVSPLPSFTPGVEVVRITDCDGPVLVQGCSFGGNTTFALAPLQPTVTVLDAAAVTFEGTLLTGRKDFPPLGSAAATAEALSATASQVQLAHCTLTGASGDSAQGGIGTEGETAVALSGTKLALLGTSITGGKGSNGVLVLGSCTGVNPGGAGISFGDATCQLFTRASGVSGGPGGSGCNAQAPDGPATTGPGLVTSLPGDSQPLDITPALVREGAAGSLQLHGTPGAGALLLLGFGQSQLWLPTHAGVLLPPATALILSLGTFPGSGVLALPYTVPALPAGVEGVTVLLQSVLTGGGPALLGGGGALVIVDASF